MTKQTTYVTVFVRGGCVQGVQCSDPEHTSIVIVDWDSQQEMPNVWGEATGEHQSDELSASERVLINMAHGEKVL